MEETIGILVRLSVAYLYALALLRLSGKHSIGALTPWDFMVALIAGDTFDDIIWGEIALSQWTVGITTIMVLHLIVSFATYKSKAIDQALGSDAVSVAVSGRFEERGLARERLRHETVLSQIRLEGVDDLAEVQNAIREPSGRTSVLKVPEARPVQKRDLSRLREVA